MANGGASMKTRREIRAQAIQQADAAVLGGSAKQEDFKRASEAALGDTVLAYAKAYLNFDSTAPKSGGDLQKKKIGIYLKLAEFEISERLSGYYLPFEHDTKTFIGHTSPLVPIVRALSKLSDAQYKKVTSIAEAVKGLKPSRTLRIGTISATQKDLNATQWPFPRHSGNPYTNC